MPELERRHRHVLEQRPRLIRDPLGIDRQDALDTGRVLHRDRGHHRQRMAAQAGQVSMSACKPAPPVGSDAAKLSTMGGAGLVEGAAEAHQGGQRWFNIRRERANAPRGPSRFRRPASAQRHETPHRHDRRIAVSGCAWYAASSDESLGLPDEGLPPGTDGPPCPRTGPVGMRRTQGSFEMQKSKYDCELAGLSHTKI
jgi:hypothetical protein